MGCFNTADETETEILPKLIVVFYVLAAAFDREEASHSMNTLDFKVRWSVWGCLPSLLGQCWLVCAFSCPTPESKQCAQEEK